MLATANNWEINYDLLSKILFAVMAVLFLLLYFSQEVHRAWRRFIPVKKTKYRSRCLYCGGFYKGVEREYKIDGDLVINEKITKECPCKGTGDFPYLKSEVSNDKES